MIVCDSWADGPEAALASAIAAAAGIEPGPLSETVEIAAVRFGEIYLLLDQVEESSSTTQPIRRSEMRSPSW